MCKTERILRIILGLIILAVGWFFYSSLWALIGLIPLITGLVGFCPIYRMIGKQSCPFKKK
ncbi:DUF2892 domain-containing protein [Campylobacter fetus]|uniref:Membrane protein n=1 Tax=Campylobacter fetus subsp. testudinum TaxID=1507806 RepID=A0AAX0HD15_CAMFE|nr:DUF2892 domain-containing protein [Campylobacter fetus]AGZ81880.1 putative protein (DUF2892 domain) [Campylobacter fetus subsp. testudinum 03-427]AVK81321.1 DUF2892 domain-containing protein [Campylobacter fetus subsp. testudinum]EAI4322754.1 DUF2892 domain-containing protein [Campylobacter fetus]EAI4390790.1 DUF2892 domain-containing protein [Campylobacter fetus]EAK0826308.1 DUF2892 domain-containing protein [Campylobacter fetus]